MQKVLIKVLLQFLLLHVSASVFAQVLVLNKAECVKVDARLSELVPHHKYRRIEIASCGTGRLMSGQEEVRYDTSAMKIEDTVSVFFIWRQHSVLRIVARKDINRPKKERINFQHSLALASLAGKPGEIVNNELQQFQKNPSCRFMVIADLNENWQKLLESSNRKGQVNLAINTRGYIVNPQCFPLVYQGGSGQTEIYRIFNISGFKIDQLPGTVTLKTALVPEFAMQHIRTGFTREEEDEEEPQQISLKSKAKGIINKVFSVNHHIKRKPKDWYFKLGQIYQEMLDVTWQLSNDNLVPKEGNEPVPYLQYSDFKSWPWIATFPQDLVNQKLAKPFYLGNKLRGYQVSDKKNYPETEGFTIVPGEFFLPSRLKIISVNNISVEKYRPSVLSSGITRQPPFFPGGATAIRNFFDGTLSNSNFSTSGFVGLALKIGDDGAVKRVEVRNGINPEVDAKVKQIAMKMPRWNAAHRLFLPEESWTEVTVRVNSAERLQELNRKEAARLKTKLAADNRIYTIVEEQPQFPGGEIALKAFINKNLRYPNSERKKATEGFIVIKFVVRNTGEIVDIELLKKLSPALDAEAIRLVKSMPPWIPGKQNEELVNVHYILPIRVTLPAISK